MHFLYDSYQKKILCQAYVEKLAKPAYQTQVSFGVSQTEIVCLLSVCLSVSVFCSVTSQKDYQKFFPLRGSDWL